MTAQHWYVALCLNCRLDREFEGVELRALWAQRHVEKAKGHVVELKEVYR